MKQESLNHFVKELSKVWGPLNSSLTKKSKELLEELTQNCIGENWVDELLEKQLPFKEVYRSEEHGFILMGHIENKGDISPPHDHGSGWVIYSTVIGQSKMGLFNRVFYPDGTMNIVQKDSYMLNAGQCSVYLPGDIHDTHTLENNTLMLRLTSCDFLKELEKGRLVRYSNLNDKW
ncbi:MAG: hypothetical protein BM557_07875 [Flavobacterium sp. MedPE-SWcel]|uniref:hypothetical protein n=1 Tax=uncultured Flavobacterium sp. TaxID=165435 RepID=UPI000916DA11|nr:hypothetical protein [uncultured Flavobacterium sp.]OIQ18123.1 MAG: hypothetical protein BM557_07875 [Flavobacterium sp. MedPE-SWcel]